VSEYILSSEKSTKPIEDLDNESIIMEYAKVAQHLVDLLQADELYVDKTVWKVTEHYSGTYISSPVIKEYFNILDECGHRHLELDVYELCVTTTLELMDELDNLDAWNKYYLFDEYHLESRSPFGMRYIIARNISYLSWLWFNNQDHFNAEGPLTILSSERLVPGARFLFAAKRTFESGNFHYVDGLDFYCIDSPNSHTN
jgi:hypothetical protein